jgi:hypothetical protein
MGAAVRGSDSEPTRCLPAVRDAGDEFDVS